MAAIYRRVGLADHVYSHVKEQLLEGAFRSGDWIPIDEIAAQLEVSRQPVMDSLKRLAVEGLVVIVPQVGSKMRMYSSQEIRDFFALHAESEALVSRFAAERAEAEDVQILRDISVKIGRLRRAKLAPFDLNRTYRLLNREFHRELRVMSRSGPVIDVVTTLGDRCDCFVTLANAPIFARRVTEAHAEHEALIEAISAREGALAQTIMRGHILAIGARLPDIGPQQSKHMATVQTARR